MTDDLVERSKMALQDINGRVEANKLEMFDQIISYAEDLEAENARLKRALETLDSDPTITVAEHVEENARLAPFLPRSAALQNKEEA